MTMMVTNAILGGIADTVAQTITSVRQRAVRKPGGVSKDDGFAIEIHELDRKNPLLDHDLIPDSKLLPPPFDFERLTRFMGYGFCMAPVQFKWFQLLSRVFPITKANAFGPAMKRVAFDQLVFAPIGVGIFFTVMTVAEGGGKRAVSNKLRDMYVPTLKANYLVWPAVQIVNFRLMPVQFQLVSQATPITRTLLTVCVALRVYCRYRLDGLSVPQQRFRLNRCDGSTTSFFVRGLHTRGIGWGVGKDCSPGQNAFWL
jgi:hypothetical protein